MNGNPRIVGAVVIGVAIMAGSYVISGFGEPPQQGAVGATTVQIAPVRTPITVHDTDQDGVEDWRDSLAISAPIELSDVPLASDYERPSTISGEFSLTFFEQILKSKMYGSFGSTEDEVIQKSIVEATQKASDVLYDERDIIVIPNEGESIRAYGNRAANILAEFNVPDTENETIILKKAMDRQDESVLQELEPLSKMYANMRDAYLNTPVPQKLAGPHLNLINSLHALHNDVEGMKTIFNDPLYSLVRIKRYQDDATALTYSLSGMYVKLAETPEIFKPNDTALMFIAFAPINNPN